MEYIERKCLTNKLLTVDKVENKVNLSLAATPHKAPTIRPPASHHENYTTTIYYARGVMVIVVGNEHGDTSSNPGRD